MTERWIGRWVFAVAIIFFAGIIGAVSWLLVNLSWPVALAALCGGWIGSGFGVWIMA